MLRHKHTDRICCMVLACTLLITCLYMGAAAGGLLEGAGAMGYESRLFDQSRVHTIDIAIDDWEGFLKTCTDEEYVSCSVVIDGEAYSNVGIRAKGNTSLSSVAAYGNNRYSFKIEFDQYQSGRTYHGLDKISLNNLIQDKTLMKDYLAYTLMNKLDAAAPLCSFVQINVNGEAWGLYLAIEAVEDGFLQRNYGSSHGELYKPDSLSFGGGRGNGRNFDMSEFSERFEQFSEQFNGMGEGNMNPFSLQFPENGAFGFPADRQNMPSGSSMAADSNRADGSERGGFAGRNRFGNASDENRSENGIGGFSWGNMGGSDVKLQYIDDNPESYSNIFSSAKTDVTEADQKRLIASLKKLSEGEDIESAVDTEAVIRYLVVHNFMVNGDSYTGSMIHNYYLYEKDGLLSMLPWDYNLSFGAFSMGGSGSASSAVNSPIDSPVSSGSISDRPIIAWIFESEEYTSLYHEIYAEFIEMVYGSGWLDQEIGRVSAMITPYVEQDPTAFFTYDEFITAADTLREFCALRCASIDGQLKGVVPSTTEAQRIDSASLIDASHISLTDMGEFSMGGGRRNNSGMQMPDRMQMPGGMQIPDGMQIPGGMQMPDRMQIPDGMQMPDTMQIPGGMQMPDGTIAPDTSAAPDRTARQGMMMPQFANRYNNTTSNHLPYLIGCIITLAAAIIVVKLSRSGR